MPRPSIELQGFTGLLEKLQEDLLLRGPIRKLFAAVGRRGKEHGSSIAPRRTGRLAGSFSYRVSTSTRISAFGVRIVATARNPRGVSYPRILEYSPKHGHKGWLRGALEQLLGRIGPEIDEAARDIEQEWRS